MSFLEITADAYRSLELAWASSENKLIITRGKSQECKAQIDAATTEADREFWRLRKYRWDELRTRCRWASRFMGRNVSKMNYRQHVQGICNRIYMMAGGNVLPDFVFKRIRTPISFTVEPCALCKTLEASFSPNDQVLRTETVPWDTQYYEILIAVATDAFKVMGAGLYYRAQIAAIEDTLTGNTPAGHPWGEVIALWDVMLQYSKQFIFGGRGCFAGTELIMQEQEDGLQGHRKEIAELSLNRKYFNLPDDTLKCVSGLYAINKELICPACTGNLEPDPITRG